MAEPTIDNSAKDPIPAAAAEVAEAPPFAIPLQILRGASVAIYLLISCISMFATQLAGFGLKFVSPVLFHAWIDVTKQSFGIFLTSLIQLYTPVNVTISGDASMHGLFVLGDAAQLVTRIGGKAILMSNHQLYVDWAYMWWIAYTNQMHGGIFIILKESLKHLPVLGWGMQFYRFIFLSRKWAKDEQILTSGLRAINEDKEWPSWLVLFPEGTTFCKNGQNSTVAYAKKTDVAVPMHTLLPRARGLRYSLLELNPTIEYLYDATIFYHDVPEGSYGENYFTLRSMYLQGHYPKKVDMYWRRWKISELPYKDEQAFEKWIQDTWYEKDALLDNFVKTGQWVVEKEAAKQVLKPITVPVRLNSVLDLVQIFAVPLALIMLQSLVRKHFLPLIYALF